MPIKSLYTATNFLTDRHPQTLKKTLKTTTKALNYPNLRSLFQTPYQAVRTVAKNVSNVNLHGKNILKCFECPEECLTICLTLLAICQRMLAICQNKLDAYAPHHHKTKDVDAAEQVMIRAIRRLVDTWSYRFLCWGTLT